MDATLAIPRRLPGRLDLGSWPGELLALGALLLAYLLWLVAGQSLADPEQLRILFLFPIDALVVVAALRAAERSTAAPAIRDFWRLIALAWAAEAVGDVILGVYDIALVDPTYPSLADGFFIAFYPLAFLALLRVPSAPELRSQRLRSALDCATIVVGGGAAIWYFALGPTLTAGGQGALYKLVSAAYPVGDLVLLGAVGLVLLRRGPETLRRPLLLIAGGLLLLVLADTVYGYQQLHGTYSPGDPVDTIYLLAAAPFVLAAVRQDRLRESDPRAIPDRREPSPRAARLPLAAMVLGFGVLIGTQRNDVFFPDLSLLFFAVALAALVALRQHYANRELAQLQERFRAIVDGVAEAILVFAESGLILWANPAAERDFGAAPGALAGRPIADLLLDVDWERLAPALGVGDDQADSILSRHRRRVGSRPDGSSFPLEMVITEGRLEGERVLIGICQDIGERNRAEIALRESEQRFHGIFDNAGVGIAFSVFERGRPRILEVNAAFTEMLGYRNEELCGDDFSLITHPDDRGDLAELGAAVAAGESRIARELRCRRRDGGFVWGSLTLSILRDGAGKPRFAIGMVEDVSRRKEAERAKDEFVSIVGHELRTPLTSIRGSLGLVDGGVLGELPPDAASMVSTAVVNTDRLVRLVNDVLDLERIDSGAADFHPVPVSAATLVEQALGVVRPLAEEAGIELRADVAELEVRADPDRVVQALTNLLGNAIKFSERNEEVELVAVSSEGMALFSVADRGRGIPASKLGSIFERFSQVDASDSREKGGTGLGLAIARRIVEQHRGRIWAESTPGVGTTFRFTLPLDEKEEER